MSDLNVEPVVDVSSETTEALPGFPGGDRAPVDAEAARMERALAHLETPEPDPVEEPSPEEPSPEEPAPDGEPDATEEPPPVAEAASPEEPTAPPGPDLTAALAKLDEMRSSLEERTSALATRETEVEKWSAFAKAAETGNILDAINSVGWKPDDIVKAIANGHGVKGPQDETRALVEEIRAENKRELEALKALMAEKEHVEMQVGITRELGSAEDRAPLVAVFGEEGQNLVMQHLGAAKSDNRVPRDQAIKAAVDSAEAFLSERVLKAALSSPGVRTKYASLLGIREQAAPVRRPEGRPLSQRDASQVTRRAPTDQLTEEERLERAHRHLK